MRGTGRKTMMAAVAAAMLCALPAAGATLADISVGASQVDWNPAVDHGGMVLKVSGGGIYIRMEFDAGERPSLSVADASGNALPDGSYVYELVANPTGRVLERERDGAPKKSLGAQSGFLRVQGGVFVSPDAAEAEAPAPGASPRTYPAAEWGPASELEGGGENPEGGCRPCGDNMTVDGSLCVGNDCPTNPSFGFDTIRMQENNTRLKFDDTSNSASFPDTDWEITANESANGGANALIFQDISNNKRIMTLTENAPSNSLFVDAQGDLGLGTATPVTEIHVVDGDTPTMRLEQNGSSGFTPQTWDLAGNETNFFLRDVTNGSKLPFRVRPNAPTSSIDIAAGTGDVGFGTTAPDSPIHVRRTNGTAKIHVEEATGTDAQRVLMELENNGDVVMTMDDSDATGVWQFKVAANETVFQINRTGGNGVNDLTLSDTGDLEIVGQLTVASGCTGCDLVFSEGYPIESIEEHSEYMWSNRHLPGVGPTPEDAPMNLSKKTGGILNELEKAHIYIEQLHEAIGELRSGLDERDGLVEQLVERLERLEAGGL